MDHRKFVCIHGHFYQPPRENPWLNTVEVQDSAYPFHDWNDRITSECYSRNAAARILDAEGRVEDIVNNYSRISFNFGATLLQWMKTQAPEVYQAILDADRESQQRFSGHGSAIAQAYNHIIVPLANERDKITQVIWGIKDFEYRFQRKPEGMWLPETAANTDTLEVLAQHGIKYTILSPYQAKRVRKIGTTAWRDATGAKVDPRQPYRCQLPSGKTISLFFYDGPVSQGIAFEGLLNDGEAFANRLIDQLDDPAKNKAPQLMHIATDGESYGHHHRYGEMGLAYCLHHVQEQDGVDISIYGEFLEKFPPKYEAEIIENTAWSSTPHLERWSEDGGGNTGGNPDWNQQWRKPLREALDWLRDELATVYERTMQRWVDDPWKTRDDYIEVVLDRSQDNVARFIQTQTKQSVSHAEAVQILKLLEAQHHAMLMYTSCGWFFDEVTGIETIQDIQYAARAIQLHRDITDHDLEPHFLELLALAPSNIPEYQNAAVAYERFIRPTIVDMNRVGAHFAVSSLFADYTQQEKVYSFSTDIQHFDKHYAGKNRLAVGKASLKSEVTWEQEDVTFAVIHLGEHHLFGGVRASLEGEAYETMREEIVDAFQKSRVHEAVVLMDKHFGMHNYSFWHLFKEDQQQLLNRVLEETMIGVENTFRQIYENNYSVLQAMKQLNIHAPRPLKDAGEFTINSKLRKMLQQDRIEEAALSAIVASIDHLEVNVDSVSLSYLAGERINTMMEALQDNATSLEQLDQTVHFIQACFRVHLQPDLWKAQNIAFIIHRKHYADMHRRPADEHEAARWLASFAQLFDVLNIHVSDQVSVQV